jgi:predicted NBD/HSP70 family sugar kinase
MDTIRLNIGVEIGGTNIKVALIDEQLNIDGIIDVVMNNKIPIKEFKTHVNPEDTIKEISKWILDENKINSTNINKVGISNFGPLNLQVGQDDYGKILNTPKPGWKGFHVVESFSRNLNIHKAQIIIELDVNCAAYLEYKLGNHG